jgi:ERCC4-type nuclease
MTVAAPPKTPILVDSREPRETVQMFVMLLGADAIPVKTQKLDSADFLLLDHQGGTLGIERKTPADFVGSLCDGRLESQLERMLLDYDHRLLVIHGRFGMNASQKVQTGGSWNLKDSQCWYAAYQAKMIAVQGRYDVRLAVVGSDEELCVLLRTLYRQGQEGQFRV